MEQSQTSSRVSGRRTTGSVEEELSIIPDGRTNSLVVVGDASKVAKVRKLVSKLDIQRPNRANNVHVIYLKNAPAKETSESLNAALGNLRISGAIQGGQHVQVTADEGTNALIITASAQDYEIIAEIVEKLDIVREQVLVEMLIMEVSQDALQEIGIDWATIDQAVDDSIRFFGGTNFGIRSGYPNSEGFSLGMWKNVGGETQIGAILNALEKETGVNILSTPHIMTSNHQRASIIVGENRPYVTDSRITETDPDSPTVIKTYDYRDVGISLEIVPHISHENHVRLEIKSEFTKLIEDVSTSADTPTTAKRQAETVVSMDSASTVVIGGLIRDDKTTVEKKVPLVGDVPLVGELFKYKKDQVEKTNLLIFITPYVMNTQDDMDRISEKKRIEMDSKVKKIMEPEDDAGIGKNTQDCLKPDGILEVDV
jgi:general secretion pathway protein D